MTKQKASIYGYVLYAILYWWLSYPNSPDAKMPGFWTGIIHGFFMLPRWVYELSMGIEAYISPNESWYWVGIAIGALITGPFIKAYMNVFLFVFQVFTRIRLKD